MSDDFINSKHTNKTIWLIGLMLVVIELLFFLGHINIGGSNKTSKFYGSLYETHFLAGKPSVEIYMRGFQDMSFNAYLKNGASKILVFQSLSASISQFGSSNIINRGNHAKRISTDRNRPGLYDLFWSTNYQRFAIAFDGNFVAAYDCKTGQEIQVREGRDNIYQSKAVSAAIERFLDGNVVTETDMAELRKQAYLPPGTN